MEKKYQQLRRENSALHSQVQEKEQKLLKLRTGVYIIQQTTVCIRSYIYLVARVMNLRIKSLVLISSDQYSIFYSF